MNGQHFNSSGSGNGTPTPPSNSSYPASLSSQSSRDPSPHSREPGVPTQYGFAPKYDVKSSPHMLVNNFSNMSVDPNKQQQPSGFYPQKSHQQVVNTAAVRSQSHSQGFTNHTSSSNVSNYNSTAPMVSPYITSGNKYNNYITTLNSSYSTSSMSYSNPLNSNPHQMLNRNQFQTSNSPRNTVPKQSDLQPVTSMAGLKVNDAVHNLSQLPSVSTNAACLLQPSLQNIPSSQSLFINSSSPLLDCTKQQPQSALNNNSSLRFNSSVSTDKLHNLPSAPPNLHSLQFVNVGSSSQTSVAPRSLNNSTSTSDSSPSPHINTQPLSNTSSVHSSQESSSLNSIMNQPSSLPPPLHSTSPAVQSTAVISSTSLSSSQTVLTTSTTQLSSSMSQSDHRVQSGMKDLDISTASGALPPSNQHALQEPASIAAAINHVEERHTEDSGSGDHRGISTNQESKQIEPGFYQSQQAAVYSQLQHQQQNQIVPSNQFVPSTQTAGQNNQNRQSVSSFNNLNQSQPLSIGSHHSTTSLPTSNTQIHNSLAQFNNFQKFPPPVSDVMQNRNAGMPPSTSFGQNVPTSNVSSHPSSQSHYQQQPVMPGSVSYPAASSTSSGSYYQKPTTGLRPQQQIPVMSTGLHQKIPPSTGGLQSSMPPPSSGPYQQMPPSNLKIHDQMPPSGLGPHRQIPPSSLGSDQRIPPPPTSVGQHQQSDPRRNPPFPSQNQFQQRPPLPNQYVQYPQQNAPVQTQPMGSGGQFGMNRYPPMPLAQGGATMDALTNQFRGANVTQDGFNKLWGMDTYDLLKSRDLLPKERIEAPAIRLNPELFDAPNCSPELFRCTLSKIPETKSLLDKSRLPFGVLIHPFKDLTQLSVIQCSTIVRCRACRTYINPFIYFVDNKRWKCNLCFRVNELPEEFQFDPMTKTYGDPSRRPEIKSATIEFIAPSEYMVRPPQPAIYLFLFDVSRLGAESGYLEVACQTLLAELSNLPGDARTSVGFITYDSSVHFYSLAEGLNQPHQMVVVDIDDMFLPCPENLLVNLNECLDLIKDLLMQLPKQYNESFNTESALGAALQAAYKLLAPTGGRVTVFQSRLPSVGPGALVAREDPSQRASDTVPHLNPSTDFYKKLALDCSSQQIAVDLFIVNSQYVDVATLSGVSRFSGGCMYHFPLFRAVNSVQVNSLTRTFQRYLTRKIGFESVMRLRCTRGLSIHTFHGNFFVRSTDLLSLPNVNPDAGFGMQVSIDENLSELQNVCFQAALLYTSSKGERRIRVHTLCLPIATNLSDILNGADQQCIVGLLAKMAVDRSIESSVIDAREAFVNVVADILSAYKLTQNIGPGGGMIAPKSLRLIPLYILALLKSVAFRTGQSTRLDDRVFAMCQMKTLPLALLIQSIYPDLYPVHNLQEQPQTDNADENPVIVPPPRLHLSSEKIDSHGVYLLDNGTSLLLYVGHNISPMLCQALFGVPQFAALPQDMFDLPDLSTPENERLRDFVFLLQSEKAFDTYIQIIREDSPHRSKFLEHLVEDKNEAGTSYYEFLQRIKVLMK